MAVFSAGWTLFPRTKTFQAVDPSPGLLLLVHCNQVGCVLPGDGQRVQHPGPGFQKCEGGLCDHT